MALDRAMAQQDIDKASRALRLHQEQVAARIRANKLAKKNGSSLHPTQSEVEIENRLKLNLSRAKHSLSLVERIEEIELDRWAAIADGSIGILEVVRLSGRGLPTIYIKSRVDRGFLPHHPLKVYSRGQLDREITRLNNQQSLDSANKTLLANLLTACRKLDSPKLEGEV